jgi:hypothetical protein
MHACLSLVNISKGALVQAYVLVQGDVDAARLHSRVQTYRTCD